jgi:hypothetical protein
VSGRTSALLQQVQENHARMQACSRHNFEHHPTPLDQGIRRRYRCTACGGEIDAHAHFWWVRGVKDGGA